MSLERLAKKFLSALKESGKEEVDTTEGDASRALQNNPRMEKGVKDALDNYAKKPLIRGEGHKTE